MPQSYEVFVSYSREDLERVKPWVDELKKGGVTVFFDRESLVGGVEWQGEIAEAVNMAKVVIFFISKTSLNSVFVPKELALAVDMKKIILPILLEPVEVRGPTAFSIAGLQRLEAYDSDLSKVWRGIRGALKRGDVDWKSPQQRPIENVEEPTPRRETANMRRPRIIDEPVREMREGPPQHHNRRWGWWLGTAAIFVGLGLVAASRFQGTPEAQAPPILPEPAPLKPIVVSFEEEAELTCRHYLEAAKDFNPAQTAYLADRTNFRGTHWSRDEIETWLHKSKQNWPQLDYRVQTMNLVPPSNPIERAVHEARVEETKGKPVVQIQRQLTLHLATGPGPNGPVILRIEEVPESESARKIIYNGKEQERVAIQAIRQSVESGNTTANMSPEQIGGMYAPTVDYFGNPKTKREDIVAELARFMKRWPVREYQIQGEPIVKKGLGTSQVEIEVSLDFTASDPRTRNKSEGGVKSAYVLTFDEEGGFLITGHQEKERFPKVK